MVTKAALLKRKGDKKLMEGTCIKIYDLEKEPIKK